MNPEYANTIPLRDILHKLGSNPVQENTDCLYYLSIFEEGDTPQLKVHKATNRWEDVHACRSGGPLELVQGWLQQQGLKCAEADVLHWLKFTIGYPSLIEKFGLKKPEADNLYSIAFKTGLQEQSLIRYVLQQGFSFNQAKRFFKQVYVLNKATGKEFRALGMRNEEGGYALYSPHLEAMTAPLSVSFIRGEKNDYERVYVFKTPFDYRRALQLYPAIAAHDSMILHAYGCADPATAYVRGFGYKRLYTVFDDSPEGQCATEAFAWLCSTEQDLKHYRLTTGQ